MPQEIKDLHTYLRDLEARHPEAMLRIKRPISLRYELTALQKKLEDLKKYPVIVAERPLKVDGSPSEHPVVVNLTASRYLVAEAIGIDPRRVALEYSGKTAARVAPVVVAKQEAPVKQVVVKGEAVDLLRLPIPLHQELDPGPYVAAGYVVTCDPETGVDNSALQRLWVKSKNRAGYFPASTSHAMANLAKWWNRGEDMPIAVWIGHHPAALGGGQVKLGYPESHWPAMGGALGQPLRLVPTETFGEKLMVPADAEVVIEGYVPREVYEAEAPFGEYTGYAGAQRPSPVVEVTCVTHRRDAIFHDFGVGLADMLVLGMFPLEARVYQIVKQLVPELVNVHFPLSGHRFHAYLQLSKTRPGIGKDAILAALPCDSRLKHVIAVDDDIDVFNEAEVLWAVATRTQWDKDLVVIPGASIFPLDPSAPYPGTFGTKGGIDATCPPPLDIGMPRQFQATNKVPDEVAGRVRVEDYVDEGSLAKFPGSF